MATDVDAQAWVDEVISNGGSVYENAIDTLIQDMKTEGLWAKTDAMNIFKWAGSQEANDICIKRLVSGERWGVAWDDTEGLTGDGVDDHFRTKYNPTTDQVNHLQDDACLIIKIKDGQQLSGNAGGNSKTHVGAWSEDPTRLNYECNASNGTVADAMANRDEQLGVSRQNANDHVLMRNGVEISTGARASASPANGGFHLLAVNHHTAGGDTPASFSANTVEYWWTGGFLTGAEQTTLKELMDDYFVNTQTVEHDLTTAVTGSGSITLDPTGGTYEDSTSVTVTAVPDEGYEFVEWQGDLTGNTNPESITMDADKSITAVFQEITFEFISPTEGSTGVSRQTPFSIENPDLYNEINLRVYDDNVDSPGDIVRDLMVSGGVDPVNRTLTEEEQLDFGLKYHSIAQRFIPGSAPTEAIVSDNFEHANQSGWPGWTTQLLTGSGSHKIESNRGVQVVSASTVVVADLDEEPIEDVDITLRFNASDISSEVQPSIHFRTQGDWLANNHIEGFYLYWNGNTLQLGRVTSTPADYTDQNLTLSRTIDEDVDVRIQLDGLDIKVAAWVSSGSQDGWDIEHTATHEYFSGGFSVKTATGSGASADSEVRYDLIEYSPTTQVPEIGNITVGETTADIPYTEVQFDNGGYEYSIKEGAGNFGSPVSIGFENPISLSGLTTDVQHEIRVRVVHNGIAGEWSEIKSFTPQSATIDGIVITPLNPEISEESGSTVVLTRSLDTSGSPDTGGVWSLRSGVSGITIQSQTDSEVTLEHDNTVDVNDTRVVRWTSNHDSSFEEVTVTVVEGVSGSGSEANDLQFLIDVYNTMDGDNWQNNTGWDTNATSLPTQSWDGTNGWFGVYVAQINNETRLVQLDLQTGVPFSNDLPDEELDVSGNGLSNIDANDELITGREFPDPVNLTEITYINVKSNDIAGPVPAGFTVLPKAERILLSGHWREPDPGEGNIVPYNHPVSSSGGKTTEGRNLWTGSLPTTVSLPECVIFECMQARISGGLPVGFNGTNCPKMEMLMLGGSREDVGDEFRMSGTIPASVYSITTLRYLFLHSQRFTGSIHSDIGQLTDARHIRLDGNADRSGSSWTGGLTGEVPASMEAMRTHLQLLTLSTNNLEGNPLFMLKSGSRLHTLTLTFNQFSGTIDPNLDPHSGYNVLGLGWNNFTGEVPRWITERRIIQVSLNFNDFTSLHSEFYNPDCVLFSGGSTSNSRLRNIRLRDNPNLTGHLPHCKWTEPHQFSGIVGGAIVTFQNTQLIKPGPLEDGRDKDGDMDSPIIQKTRADWYKHYWDNYQGL